LPAWTRVRHAVPCSQGGRCDADGLASGRPGPSQPRATVIVARVTGGILSPDHAGEVGGSQLIAVLRRGRSLLGAGLLRHRVSPCVGWGPHSRVRPLPSVGLPGPSVPPTTRARSAVVNSSLASAGVVGSCVLLSWVMGCLLSLCGVAAVSRCRHD